MPFQNTLGSSNSLALFSLLSGSSQLPSFAFSSQPGFGLSSGVLPQSGASNSLFGLLNPAPAVSSPFQGLLAASGANAQVLALSSSGGAVAVRPTPSTDFIYQFSSPTSAIEGSVIDFTITRSGGSGFASTVYVSTRSGTATSNSDFAALERIPVKFSANSNTATVRVSLKTDVIDEIQESFFVDLFASSTGGVALTSGLGLIDDRNPLNLGGGLGRDTIVGDARNNTITGGGGGDFLTGGAGRDVFRYTSTTDSGLSSFNQDRILDFRKGEDKIDLSMIDADINRPGDQAFSQIVGSSNLFRQGGQMKIVNNGNLNFTVLLNTDIGSAAESGINVQLVGVPAGRIAALDFSDFIL